MEEMISVLCIYITDKVFDPSSQAIAIAFPLAICSSFCGFASGIEVMTDGVSCVV
jgi:hypothetical protein